MQARALREHHPSFFSGAAHHIAFFRPCRITNLQAPGTPRDLVASLALQPHRPAAVRVRVPSAGPRLGCPAASLRSAPVRVSSRALAMDASSRSSGERGKGKIRVVEHVVLLKVKEGVPEAQTEAMVSALRGLQALPSVIHITAGKNSLSTGTDSGPETFSHALHSRYYSKEDLDSYANDPLHLDVIKQHIAPIVEDRIAVDWETELEEPDLVASSGLIGAVRIVAMRPNSDPSVSHLVDTFSTFEERFASIKQVSFGTNFSPRSKGYEFGYVALLPNLRELSELTKNEDYADVHRSSIFPALEKYTVVEYSST